jgi:hypothetical protein
VNADPARTPSTRDSSIAHADADQVGVVVHALQKTDQRDVVVERLGGGDNLDEIGAEGLDAAEYPFQIVRSREVVVADQQPDPGHAQLLQLGLLHGLGGFQFQVHQMEPRRRAFGQNLQFGGQRAVELAAVRSASTGGDGGRRRIFDEELLEPRQRKQRLLKVVQTKLEERRLLDHGGCLFDHLSRRGAGDGHANLGNAGAQKLGGVTGYIQTHRRNRVSYTAIAQDATFPLNICDCAG